MKLSCTQENLSKALFIASNISGQNTTLPILNNLLLEARDGLLYISSTDLEIGIVCEVRGKIEQTGKITVPSRLLANYISLLPKDRVDLEVKENVLHIKCGEHQTKINAIDAEEFPVIPKIDKKDVLALNAENFRQAVSQVLVAVSIDENRPEIGGVLFKFDEKSLVLVGTDSYRLAEKTVDISSNKINRSVIVPLKTIKEVIRSLNIETEKIEVYLADNQILFCFNGVELISRLIEAEYPDYQQIIPTNFKTQAIIDKQEFLGLIKTAGLFAQAGNNSISLELTKSGQIKIIASSSQLGEEKTQLPVEMKGNPLKIIFDYRYLLDGLSNMDTENVSFEFVDSSAPAVLKPHTEKKQDYIYIIMPIRQ